MNEPISHYKRVLLPNGINYQYIKRFHKAFKLVILHKFSQFSCKDLSSFEHQ